MGSILNKKSMSVYSLSNYGSSGILGNIRKHYVLYIMIIPCILQFIIFSYLPMFGIVIAFEDYNIVKGFFKSPFIGLKNFEYFFGNYSTFRIIRNSILLSLYDLLWGFPVPIIIALLLNEAKSVIFKRVIQTVTFLPYFLSTVIIVGIVMMMLSVDTGIVNLFLSNVLGMEKIDFLTNAKFFRSIYVITSVWQRAGWCSIIYLASIVSIDQEMYSSAIIDGASRLQKMIYITLPCIAGTIVVMLILSLSSILSVGFERVYLLSRPITYSVSDVIETYVYRMGLGGAGLGGAGGGLPDYSLASAVGLFQSTVNAMLLFSANWFCGRFLGRKIY